MRWHLRLLELIQDVLAKFIFLFQQNNLWLRQEGKFVKESNKVHFSLIVSQLDVTTCAADGFSLIYFRNVQSIMSMRTWTVSCGSEVKTLAVTERRKLKQTLNVTKTWIKSTKWIDQTALESLTSKVPHVVSVGCFMIFCSHKSIKVSLNLLFFRPPVTPGRHCKYNKCWSGSPVWASWEQQGKNNHE